MAQYGNALVKKAKTTSEQPCTFTANGVEVKLTPATVKNYLVSGNAERITDQEVVMFINLCKYNSLNPWLREAYCIKYGSSPATMIRKVALVQALREAFPARLGALYTAEERGYAEPVEATFNEVPEADAPTPQQTSGKTPMPDAAPAPSDADDFFAGVE